MRNLRMDTKKLLLALGLFMMSAPTLFYSQLTPHISEKRLSKDTSKADIDGVYIFYNDEGAVAKQVIKKNGTPIVKTKHFKKSITGKKFQILVNDKEHFPTRIQKQLQNQPSVYPMPEKFIAISDIEGEYNAFRTFLINNKVIDKNNQWIFGSGHLITLGDFFDRGLLVTQTLWLIYSLEEQAEKAGGKVHFILGNHDIMNMSHDFRYVRKKYFENARLMNEEYINFYKPNTELGRWLGTKNIIEKIGSYVFVHAGISKEVSDLNLSIPEMNSIARRYYFNTKSAQTSSDKLANGLYMYAKSPTWYRGFGKADIDRSDFEEIRQKMGADKFVIGHTLHTTITYLLDKKVIDIDVHHAGGKTQGLLVENGKEYAVDIHGNTSAIVENASPEDGD
ncbi:metallophosphoesterase [Bergeyella cardium]|nr:metallophosphoesterase [Bergeyella cardium]